MATKDEEENKDENLNSANESDDTFGLPDIEYEPINREEPQEEPKPEPEQVSEPVAAQPVQEPTHSYQSSYSTSGSQYAKKQEEEESSSMGIKILGIVVLLLIAGGAAYYFLKYVPDQKKKAEQEELARVKAEQAKKAREAEAERQRLALEAEQKRLDSLAAIPKEGTIEALSARTGRYYVVVSSAVDDDLIMDYAKKLSDKGVSSKIIPPFGKHKFFRIAVAEGESFNDAQQKADAIKQDYSDAVWVLKY